MPLKYSHPTIVVDEPAPGHYAINGHNPKSVFIEGEGHIVPPHITYISPEIPSELLEAILVARGYSCSVEAFDQNTPTAVVAPPSEKKEHWKTREKRERAAAATSCGAEV